MAEVLAMVGEGVALTSVNPDVFPVFLQEYLQAAARQDCEVRPFWGGCLAVAYG